MIKTSLLTCIGILLWSGFVSAEYTNEEKQCAISLAETKGGIAADYNSFCRCYLADIEPDSEDYKNIDYEYFNDEKIDCFMKNGPYPLWKDLLYKSYIEISNLPSIQAKCMIDVLEQQKDKDTLIHFTQMRLRLQEKTSEFEALNKKMEESCSVYTLACSLLKENLQKITNINKPVYNLLTSETEPPLITALKYKCEDLIDNILAYNPNVNIQSIDESTKITGTPLIWASTWASADILDKLITRNADIHYQEENQGYTALIVATEYDNLEAVQFLIEKGIDINKPLHNGATPLMFAMQHNNKEIIDLLTKKNAKININAKSEDGYGFLSMLAYFGHTELVKQVLEMGTDVNEKNDITEETPLTTAVEAENEALVQLLLDKGADPNLGSHRIAYRPHSALEIAILKKNFNIIKLLIEHKATLTDWGITLISEFYGKNKNEYENEQKIIELLKNSNPKLNFN